MAAGAAADKENAAPSTSAAATTAGHRRHGYGVRSCGVKKKRPSRARWTTTRVPLRDITNLVAPGSAAAEPTEVPLGQGVSPAAASAELPKPDAVEPAAAVLRVAAAQDGPAGGPAPKQAPAAARYSLRKEFR